MAEQGGGTDVPGIDRRNLEAWWRGHVDAVDPPLSFSRIEGGLSNLTYEVCDAGGRGWVLRRPPLHGVIQSAHDMAGEHRIMAALAGSGVPVPPMIGHEDDERVTGAEFYVMDFVTGPVYRNVEMVETTTDPALRARISEAMVDRIVRTRPASSRPGKTPASHSWPIGWRAIMP